MIDKVNGKRLGGDINPYLIKALRLIRDNPHLIPRNNNEYTKERFEQAKLSDLSDPVDCFAMFQYSFGCVFKGYWAKNNRGTDYVNVTLHDHTVKAPFSWSIVNVYTPSVVI